MRWLVFSVLAAWGFASTAHAQAWSPEQPCPPGFACPAPARPTLRFHAAEPDPGAFTRGAAIFGVVSAGLLLGGSIAIAAIDDVDSEQITRGVWLGTLGVSVPFVALGAWTARRRQNVQGFRGLRVLGWLAWSGGVANGTVQWYEALHGESQPWPITVGLGVVGVLSVLPHALDAFVSGRRATMRARIAHTTFGPGGLTLRF